MCQQTTLIVMDCFAPKKRSPKRCRGTCSSTNPKFLTPTSSPHNQKKDNNKKKFPNTNRGLFRDMFNVSSLNWFAFPTLPGKDYQERLQKIETCQLYFLFFPHVIAKYN